MRVVFTAVPAAGHVWPMLPFLRAVRRAGHEVAVLSGGGAGALVPSLEVVEVGPSVPEALAETARRMGGEDGRHPGAAAVEIFGGVRLDRFVDPWLAAARRLRPDLVVHETFDVVGPLVGAELGLSRVEHRISGHVPPALLRAIAERARDAYPEGRPPTPPVAVLDPYPELLLAPEERSDAPGRIAIRPEPHTVDDARPVPLPPVHGPVAALTLGTSLHDAGAVRASAVSLADAGFTVLVTVLPSVLEVPPRWRERIHPVGFVPLAQLVPAVDVVVGAGGTGTMLAALSAGRPMVLQPSHADQPWNAERVARQGAGVTIEDAAQTGAAARRVLDEPAFRAAADRIAGQIAGLDDADTVLERVTALVAGPAPRHRNDHAWNRVTHP